MNKARKKLLIISIIIGIPIFSIFTIKVINIIGDNIITNRCIKDRREEITLKEALSDCNKLKKLMEKYAGYKYYNEIKYDFNKANISLIEDCRNNQCNNMISKELFTDLITKNYGFIDDGHFEINYSDNNNFIVKRLNEKTICIGDDEKIANENEVVFNKNKNIIYMKITSFNPFKLDERLKSQYMYDIKKSEYFILDLIGNTGGKSKGTKFFIDTFFSESDIRIYLYKKLIVPEISTLIFPQGLKLYFCSRLTEMIFNCIKLDDEEHYNIVTDYKGQIFILIDDKTASTSELCINFMMKYTKNKPILLGQSTYGALLSGNPVYCLLPKSNIILTIPTVYGRDLSQISERYEGECKGFSPDIVTEKGKEIEALYKLIPEEYLSDELFIN